MAAFKLFLTVMLCGSGGSGVLLIDKNDAS